MATTSPQESAEVKLRSACDECRFKKLKCGGEQPQCARCTRESVDCVYSPQGPMGRPKKRRKTNDESSPNDTVYEKPTSKAKTRSSNADNHGAIPSRGDEMNLYSGEYEPPFTPGGSVQPWLTEDWTAMSTGPESSSHVPDLPSLTPDSTSNTDSNYSDSVPYHPDSSAAMDPLLVSPADTGPSKHPTPACACLSTLYLTLSTIQSMDEAFAFPFVLHPLREAMKTASDLLNCTECPTRFITGLQNTGLLGTLLISIAERFSKVLESINVESERAATAGESKKFRLADLNNSTSHLHTGGLDCAASFSLDLSPEEWRSMAKKVVRAEVHGPSDGNTCCPFFMQLTSQMEERQNRWHRLPLPQDYPKGGSKGTLHRTVETKDGEHQCLKNVMFAKQLVDDFDWS